MKLDLDSRGIAISLDILLALIPLTIVLGMVAADMDNIMYQMEDTIFRGSTERVAADSINTLLTTSGTPPDWETTGNPSVVGLAKYDASAKTPYESVVSSTKLYALNSSHLQSLIGNYSFYLNVTTADGISPIRIVTNSPTGLTNSSSEVVRVQRIARASQYEIVSSIVGDIRYVGSPRQYTAPNFLTSYNYLQNYDYWIYIKNSGFNNASVVLNNTNTIILTNATINTPYKINATFLNSNSSSPNTFYNNSVKITPEGGVGSYMDFYIVQTPKNVTSSNINSNTVTPKDLRFILYIWPT